MGSGGRWDTDGKTIYDLSRAQYDDEAVTLKQMEDITDKKMHMVAYYHKHLKADYYSIDCDSSDNSDKDAVNKKYLDSKTFTLDVSKGFDMKGNKVINVADPTSATDGNNQSYIYTKISNYF